MAQDRLLSQLNQSKTTASDRALWQVIKQLIDKIHALENAVGSSSNTNITNITQVLQYLGNSEDSGGDGDSTPIPGQQGIKGDTGSTGPTGPPFPAFIFLDADLPEEPLPIPGPQGIQGATGNTGPSGSAAIGFVIYEGAELDEVPMMIPPSGSIPWELVATQAVGGASNYDFTNLGSYTDILVITVAVTRSGAVVTQIRVSTDNGSTYLSSSGDYVSTSTAGVDTNLTGIPAFTTGSASARSGWVLISGFNISGGVRMALAPANPSGNFFITNTSAFNAIRVTISAGTFNSAGNIYVYGRK